MHTNRLLLIHPPVAKPSEPPAGIARLAATMRRHRIPCAVIDANLQGVQYLLENLKTPEDTWSRRARRHLDRHLAALRSPAAYARPDVYRRAIADISRLLSFAGREDGIRLGLADYGDARLTPVRRADLVAAAREPERNPYFEYYRQALWPRIEALNPRWVGISINFLSQALCAFALIGLLRRWDPGMKIVIGGGLVTSWLQNTTREVRFEGWVDLTVAGPGETALLRLMKQSLGRRHAMPDYDDLTRDYLSPGFVLPYSASRGCWWRRCTFCPEHAEQGPFCPVPHTVAVDQLRRLTRRWRPCLIHLLDNALSPALLRTLVAAPPGAPWYGFVRIGSPLDDPGFCRRLAAAGCTMLKLGLESGDQAVLDALGKGVRLETAVRVLHNLKQAGIATYVYLLFGTPAEDEAAACRTVEFIATHGAAIDFLNLAIFNLPLHAPDAADLHGREFYPGDLMLYRDFDHPKGWHRAAIRRFLDRHLKKNPAIQPILRRNPPVFTSNHAAFFTPGFVPGS